MPIPRSTKFIAFDLTKEEFYTATRFSDLQLMLIQSMYADKAQERLALTVDVSKPTEFIQQEACLKGSMEVLEQLIMWHQETEVPTAETAKESADMNSAVLKT